MCSGSDDCTDVDCRVVVGELDFWCSDFWDYICANCAVFKSGCNGLDCSSVGSACIGSVYGCDVNMICVDTEGGYECQCDPGYLDTGSGCVLCIEIESLSDGVL